MPNWVTDEADEADHYLSLVRPFTLTGGRTRGVGVAVAVETIVAQSRTPSVAVTLGPVEAEIWRLADQHPSAAEIATRLDLPFGVVRVLVSDLVATGHLYVGRTAPVRDVNLIERLIDGVRSL
jgi:hypothetical protein